MGQYEHFYEDEEISYLNVCRWFNGSFLIVQKRSIYNKVSGTYDGRHSKFNAEEFREYMETLQYIYRHKILKDYFWGIANRDPFKDGFLKELKLIKSLTDEQLKKGLGIDKEN